MSSLKVIAIISFLMSSLSSLSQNENYEMVGDFYIVDTITINNPIVFYKSNQSGKFVGDMHAAVKTTYNIKKAIKDGDIYILGDDLYRFLNNLEKIKQFKYPDYGNCNFETEKTEVIKGIVYKRFKEKPNKYLLALVNVSFYDDIITVYGKKKSIFNKYDSSFYYKIVFPICE